MRSRFEIACNIRRSPAAHEEIGDENVILRVSSIDQHEPIRRTPPPQGAVSLRASAHMQVWLKNIMYWRLKSRETPMACQGDPVFHWSSRMKVTAYRSNSRPIFRPARPWPCSAPERWLGYQRSSSSI